MSTAAVGRGRIPSPLPSTPRQVCVRCEQWRNVSQYTIGTDGSLAPCPPPPSPRPNPQSSPSTHGQICLRCEQGRQQRLTVRDRYRRSLASIAADVAAGAGPQSIAADLRQICLRGEHHQRQRLPIRDRLERIAHAHREHRGGSSPQSVSVDPSGHHVYVANRGSSTVSIYTIGANGSLTGNTPSSVPARLPRSRSR